MSCASLLTVLSILLAVHSSSRAVAQSSLELKPPPPTSVETARASLVGPSVELASGLTVLFGAPLLALTVAIATAGTWSPSCEDGFSGKVDATCEAQQQEESGPNLGPSLAVGVIFTAIGAGLLGHGIARVRRIRRARRALLEPPAITLGAQHGGGRVSLAFSF